MSKSNILQSDCRSCSRTTRHEVIYEITEESRHDWLHESDSWQIVRCLGCLTTSFRHQNDDYDEIEEDEDGNAHHAVTVAAYPGVISNHSGLRETYFLPPLINKIYKQTLKALGEKAYVLASIGLRATIEAVCTDLGISGNSLEKRIDHLYKGGYVSSGDKKRLHAIRFLGNDAAHEIKEPRGYDIRIALEIVEHLLNTVYILEHRASDLETVAETYEEFLKLLRACAAKYDGTNAINLLGILGRQRRLIAQGLDTFEEQLKTDIEAGKIDYLSVRQEQEVAGKHVQLYEIQKDELQNYDIPF